MINQSNSILKWLIRIGLSLWIATIFFHSPGVNGFERAQFHEMIHGQAWRPYVTRALFPAVVRCISQTIPSSLESTIQNHTLFSRFLSDWYAREKLLGQPPFLREYMVAFLLSVACLILLSMTMEALWKQLFRPSVPQAYMFSVLGLVGLPVCFKYYSYIYDFPTLLLSSACILMLARRQWKWYFVLFGLACLNKETTVLLIAVFALYYAKCPSSERRTYWRFIVIQSFIFLIIRGGITWIFRGNPGGSIEFHLINPNLRILMKPWSVETLAAWGLLATLFFRHYTSRPLLLRIAAAMLIPLLGLCVFFGNLDELRDYYEVYVPISLLIGVSVCELLGYRMETHAPTKASGISLLGTAAES